MLPTTTLDLTRDAAFLRVLMADRHAWRQRLTERFEFGAGNHVQVTSEYQCRFRPPLMREFLPRFGAHRVETVKCLVPVTTRWKRPLLGFELSGPGADVSDLLPRREIGPLAAGYVEELISTSGAAVAIQQGLPQDLIEAICVFTPGLYLRLLEGSRNPHNRRVRRRALREYLKIGLGFEPSRCHLDAWMERSDRAGRQIATALGEPWSGESSSESVLLALPNMNKPPGSPCAVARIVRNYELAVDAAHSARDVAVLQALGDYGRRYDVIAQFEVPLNEPWQVRLKEDRPLRWRFRRSRQVIGLTDASSVHFDVTTTDPSVRLNSRRHRIRTALGADLRFGAVEDVRATDETLSLYASQPGREPPFPELLVAFRRPAYVRAATLLIIGLVVTAIGMAVIVDNDDLIDTLTLLIVPTTFAASQLVVREETALGGRLDQWPRLAVVAGTVILWVVVLWRVACEGVRII